MGQSVYILADTFFISVSSGANGLAVLNLILPVFGIMFAIGSMIGIGSATRYGIRRAKGEEADHYFTQSISWAVLFSIPFMLIGIFFPDKFLALLGADAELIALGKTYLRIVLVFAPFFMCNYSVTAFARNDYATSTVMAGSLAGSAFNIVFDYIFIFPAGLGFSVRRWQLLFVRVLRCWYVPRIISAKMQHRFQMEKTVRVASDLLLSAWRVRVCGRNFLRSDHVHI